jgi:peptidoglycan/xylan/chitin deacetylase (PgdA/CDA1 family)
MSIKPFPFVVRDDDLSAHTPLAHLRSVYDPLFERGIRVSFAAIPYAYRVYHPEQNQFSQNDTGTWLGTRTDIIDYLTPYIQSGQVEIMMHGFDHRYKENAGNNNRLGECLWKNKHQLRRDFTQGKQHLEEIFHIHITSFVPPSNAINGVSVDILKEIGFLYLSGTINSTFNRTLTPENILRYIQYVSYRTIHGRPYPRAMHEGPLSSLTYHSLHSQKQLDNIIAHAKKSQEPIVLATHYWELYSNINHKRDLLLFALTRIQKMGGRSVLFRDILS